MANQDASCHGQKSENNNPHLREELCLQRWVTLGLARSASKLFDFQPFYANFRHSRIPRLAPNFTTRDTDRKPSRKAKIKISLKHVAYPYKLYVIE